MRHGRESSSGTTPNADRFELGGELFEKISCFLALVRGKRRRRSDLALMQVRFDRDYGVLLGPHRTPTQPSKPSGRSPEQRSDIEQINYHRGVWSCLRSSAD